MVASLASGILKTYTASVSTPADRSRLDREIAMALRELLQVGREVRDAMGTRLGVGETDLLAMDHIARQPNLLGPVELGRRLGITSASATVLVDRLESAGHLRRVPHERDGRRITLEPTAAAVADIREVIEPMVDAVNRLTGNLDRDQAEVVLEFLTGATVVLRDYAAGPGRGSDG